MTIQQDDVEAAAPVVEVAEVTVTSSSEEAVVVEGVDQETPRHVRFQTHRASQEWELFVLSPRSKMSGRFSAFFRSCFVAPRMCASCIAQPCARVRRGRKRPTWTYKMELAVATLRAATRSIPREPNQFRFWADHAIPGILLPKGASRCKTVLGSTKIEWVIPACLNIVDRRAEPATRGEQITKTAILEMSKLRPIALYLHGGAYMVCSSGTHREMMYSLAIAGNMLMVVPNYRRVPEATVMDAVDDCFQVYQYLVVEAGVDPSRIALMGDSAGGALAVLTMCRIRDETQKVPACIVLLSPWVDLDDDYLLQKCANINKTVMPEYDYLPIDAVLSIANQVKRDLSPRDPLICPMYADLTAFPPMLIHIGEVEVLRNQIERFAQKCADAKLDVTAEVLTDMVHVGHMFSSMSVVAKAAIRDAARFVNSHIKIS